MLFNQYVHALFISYKICKGVENRLPKASRVFFNQHKLKLYNRHLRKGTKIRVY